jgi:hypothetical protein
MKTTKPYFFNILAIFLFLIVGMEGYAQGKAIGKDLPVEIPGG